MKDNLVELLSVIALSAIIALVIFLAILEIVDISNRQHKPLQTVVCDTSYGVQYFEHKGVLTLRVNHEGVPIRCYE